MALFRNRTSRSKSTTLSSQTLESFRLQIANQAVDEAKKMTQDWLDQTTASLKDALAQTLSTIASSTAQGSPGDWGIDSHSDASGSQSDFSSFGNSLGRLITSAITSATRHKETSVKSEETSRSVQSNQDFRRSTSQQRAQAASAVKDGQRNL